jgi:tetratricopeptide (TPR) repeat protein
MKSSALSTGYCRKNTGERNRATSTLCPNIVQPVRAVATQALHELREIAERCGMRYLLGFTHRLLGEIALHTNPTQVAAPLAASHFEQSIALLRAIHAENELALAYAGYGRLQQQQGHLAQARGYLARALETFERLGTLGEPDKVRQALAALPGG